MKTSSWFLSPSGHVKEFSDGKLIGHVAVRPPLLRRNSWHARIVVCGLFSSSCLFDFFLDTDNESVAKRKATKLLKETISDIKARVR